MPDERDGQHAGGSIVDTARANTSPEQIMEDNEARQRQEDAEKRRKEDHR